MKNIEIYAHTFYFTYFLNLGLGTNHLRRRQIFQDFLPLPPYRRQFFTTIRRQIWQIFDPSPPKQCRRLKWMVPNENFRNSILATVE